MITNEKQDRVRGWFTGRVPDDWQHQPVAVAVDREEVIVALTLADVELPEDAGAAELEEARAGRAKAFREDTREQRIEIAREADVRLLALTHVSTRYGGGEIREEATAVFERTVVPRDFDAIEIPFPEKGEPELERWERPERARA